MDFELKFFETYFESVKRKTPIFQISSITQTQKLEISSQSHSIFPYQLELEHKFPIKKLEIILFLCRNIFSIFAYVWLQFGQNHRAKYNANETFFLRP